MRDHSTPMSRWRGLTRSLGVFAVLVMLLALAIGVGMAAGEAPTAVDAPAGKSSIGDCVWNDANVDGFQTGGEVGIDGVTVFLYKDGVNGPNDGVFNETAPMSTTVTAAGGANATGTVCQTAGYYDFPVDSDEQYWVRIPVTNTDPGGALEDYVFTSANTSGSNPFFVNLPLNQTDFNLADFGYVKVDLRIKIGPNSAFNAVNLQHTFTVTVERKIGSGPWTPLAGATPSVSYSPTPATPGTSPVACGPTNGNGECQVSINSATSGVFTANATVTTNVVVNLPDGIGGTTATNVSRTRATGDAKNTAAGGSGNATKTYVNLRISISPNTDTNPVNQSHTFTVKVEQQIGTGGWTPVQGASPSVTVSPTPSTPAGSCGTTDANGECSVTINSNAAGVFTASASVTYSVSGQSMTRSTNSDAVNTAAGGSGNATKTYVNLRISISPNTDTNPVNQAHNFVVKVEQQVGTGAWTAVSGVIPTVLVSPAPSTPPGGCGPTNSQGECTVTINSNASGVFTASATVTYSVNGQVMTRSTNADAVNIAAGGTGNATKTYVNLRISVSPNTDTNPVNQSHTFIVKVEQQIGTGGWTPVQGVFPAGTVTPTPSTITNNCTAGGTDANGECTIVINSTTAVTYTANASITATVSGQSMTRSTNSDAVNIAAGGSGPATKIYKSGSIGDFVWWDIDKDGRQDAGEPGINGVTVRLFSNATCTGSPTTTATTVNGGSPATDGYYIFSGLGAGTFCIDIDPTEFNPGGTLENWVASPKDAAPDTVDSDGDPANANRIVNIVIDPVSGTQDDPTRDYGFFKNSNHTITKTRVTDPTGTGVRINEPISFTITVVNTGQTWLDVVPISDTYDSTYIEFLSASISGVNTPPNVTVTQTPTKTQQWTDITGAGSLAPGASIVLNVVFVGVGDTTQLPAQSPCTLAQFTCNQVSTSKPGGVDGPTIDPDGPTGPLPPLETIPPKKDDDPAKVVNPTSVALADYGATMAPGNVTLYWTTVNESQISGFNIYRIDESGNSVVIASVAAEKPGQSAGASYTFVDSSAAWGVSYRYVLEAQLFSGGTESQSIAKLGFLWLASVVR